MTSPTVPTSAESYDAASDAMRPRSLADFTGQPAVSRQLGIRLDASRGRGQMPPHLMFSGPPGLGKTTLAMIVAEELELPLTVTSGPALDKPGDLAALLSRLPGPAVVFIDEIHRMQRKIEELLYPAMEDRVLDIRIGEDAATARLLRIEVQPFVLIGATTQLGLVSAPLRERFGYLGRLALYDEAALASILLRSAALLGMDLPDDAAAAIAARSRGTPRVANVWLEQVRDYAQVETGGRIDAQVVADTFDAFGVDPIGLDDLGQDILRSLVVSFDGGPVGLTTLAAAVDETPGTVSDVYEPFLLRRGLLARTPRGRIATAAAYRHFGMEPPVQLTNGDPGPEQGELDLPFDEAG